MKIIRLSLVLALLGTACSDPADPDPNPEGPTPGAPAPTAPPAQRDERLTGLVDSERSKQSLVGFAMAVARPDGQIISAASGDAQLDPKRSFGPNDRTCVGSVTKTFTAVVVHQLVDELRAGEMSRGRCKCMKNRHIAGMSLGR